MYSRFKIVQKPVLLAIESSCDDTSVAIWKDGNVLSNVVSSQIEHVQYGGIVPEVASRAHQESILPVTEKALSDAGIRLPEVDAIAVTAGPGLLGSLIVGMSFAKGLALSLNVPLLAIHHMEAHVLAHFAEPPYPGFPFLCLTVSGGHTQIVRVNDFLDMEILGETLDDAAGEAFDKSGKLLGLGYPAGPQIDRLAQEGQPIFPFPKPQLDGYQFSFSGLKTAIRYFIEKETRQDPDFIRHHLNDLCASIQAAIIQALMEKLIRAAQDTGITTLALAGGVSANSGLRKAAQDAAHQYGWELFIPDFAYCTDNAGMIAVAGYYKYLEADFAPLDLAPAARMPLPNRSIRH